MRPACVHDGRAGHRSQAEGLCRWLAGGTTHLVTAPTGWGERLARATLWAGASPAGAVEPAVEGAQAVVSVGTRAAVAGLAVARRLAVPAISMMRPWGVPEGRFRGMLLPAHDLPEERPGTCRLLLAPAALAWRDGERRDEVGVLLGGPRHGGRWPWRAVRDALAGLSRLAAGEGLALRVAVSRRTPLPLVAAVEDAGHRAIAPGEPPSVPDLLGRVRGVVVTDDSFSMVGEAVQAGLRPLVWRLGGAGRLESGLRALAERDWIRWGAPGALPDLVGSGPAPAYDEVRAHGAAVRDRVLSWTSSPS